MVSQQIPLNLQLRKDLTFKNFVESSNESLIHMLKSCEERFVYIWGEASCGKTHLLQAVCHQQGQEGKSPVYLSLKDTEVTDPEILTGLENMDVVCIDDVHVIKQQADWEVALFNLFNLIRDANGYLIISGDAPPNELGMNLQDLVSRLSWGIVIQVQTLNDVGKMKVLQTRASQMGLDLPDDIAEYLLKRSPRDMSSLVSLLDKLNIASLTEKRRLTIPFVRQYL